MNEETKPTGYQPGFYGKKRQAADQWVEAYCKKWALEEARKKEKNKPATVFPCICFSRRIGVGALEIADLLADLKQFRVVDRQLMEHMARDASLSMKLIELFDERYPGRLSELFTMLISEKTFIKSDYARQLTKTVTALASSEPTIFVGRGIHLILPRDQTLSVRLICSTEFRITRLADILNIEKTEAQKHLDRYDREQQKFFKTVYQKEETDLDGIDLVINRDHLNGALEAAKIVACAFEQKFGLQK
ncbi:MAG: cytidylate kinase-like family protein [Desulfotignum sp.]|nr:cytidylate kinase-like family protein [Desulfotignum sp.]